MVRSAWVGAMTFRKFLFWAHLTAGVIAGVVILVMSVTGTLLTLQQSVLRTIERSQRTVAVPDGAKRLPLDDLTRRVREAIPGAEPATVTVEADPTSAVAVAIGAAGTAYVNPYTGAVLGTGSARARGFYRTVTNWHRYLAMSGEQRAVGKAITGACNAAFLALAITGLYIWMPRQWTWRHVTPVIWFRRGVRGKARDFNWHNTIGLWSAPVLIVLTLSGMVISYPWASNLVYTITGSPLPAAAQGRGGGPGGEGRGGGGRGRGGEARGGGAAREMSASGAPAQARGDRAFEARPEGRRPLARGGDSPVVPGVATNAAAASAAANSVPVVASTDLLMQRAARQVPTWSTIALRLPARPGGPATATISDGAHWNRFARSTLTIDGRSGDVTKWDPYAATSAGQKLRGWLRFAHTGELGGPVGEVIAGLACLGGAFLVYTGFALSLRRFAAWRARLASRATASSVSASVQQ